jgi:hypothetical protein
MQYLMALDAVMLSGWDRNGKVSNWIGFKDVKQGIGKKVLVAINALKR